MRLSCLLQHHLYGDNLPGCMVLWHAYRHTSLYTVFMSGIHAHTFTCMYMWLYCLCWIGNVMNQTLNYDSSEFWIAILRPTVFQLEEEFSLLAGSLGLLSASFQPSASMNSGVCLEWSINAFELISQWCSELISLADKPSQQAMVSYIHSCHLVCESMSG